jgi:transcriptional regulator with XRE-family HTH domain
MWSGGRTSSRSFEEVREMARMRSRPKYSYVSFRGLPYRIDLVKCRRALVHCQVEGKFGSMEELADEIAISRSTTSRYFSGRSTSLMVTLKILAALGLKFEDVAEPVEDDDEDEPDGPDGAGVRIAPGLDGPGSGTALRLGA